MIKITGGDALLRALSAESIPFVFGVVGGKLGAFLHAVAERPSTRYIGTRHEGHAAMMAAAVYPASGKLGVVVGECGSGGGNLVPGIAIAHANHLPMLAITSNNQHAASYPGRGMFAEMDTEAVFRPITKWNTAIHDGRRIPELVHRALREALSGRRGPVHLDVPQDIMRAPFEYDEGVFMDNPGRYRVVEGPAPTTAQVTRAAELLLKAQRPLLLAGGGVTAAGATESFRALAKALNAAAAATQMGHGTVPSTDPRYIGMAWVCGGDAVRRACLEADVVLAVGCRFSSWLWDARGTLVSHGAKVIQVDVDAGAIGKNTPVELGMVADGRIALDLLLAEVSSRLPTPPPRPWVQELTAAYAGHRAALHELAQSGGDPMHPAALADAIARALPSDALVTLDGGHTTFWGNDYLPVDAPRTRFNEPGMSQLGFGLPWAMTLKLLHEGKPVINITGDGAFGFSVQELDTARRLGLPVITIIHNNASWGVIRLGYTKAGFEFGAGRDYGTSLGGTDYAAIATGFGGHGEVVERALDFAPAFERALKSARPAVLDCRVRFEPHPAMPHFARMSSAGA